MNDMTSRAAVRLSARSSLLALAVAAGLGAPALAQTAPAQTTPATPAPTPAPAAGGAAAEQTPHVEIAAPQTITINRIIVQGAQRIDQTTVLSYLPIRPGDAVDASVLDVAVRTLSRTGLFADVQLGVQNGDLIVQIKENPIINQVVFEGNKALSQDKLTKEVTLAPRGIYTRAKVQEDVGSIVELYRLQGRISATVTPKLVQLDQNRVDVIFEINEGPQTGISAINILGNHAFSDRDVRGVMVTEKSTWWKFFSNNDNYDPNRLEYDQEQLRKFYTNRGYYDFRVVSSIAELQPDDQAFQLTLTLNEGDKYNFGDVKVVTQNDRLNADFLQRLIPIRSGDLYESDKIEQAVDALTFAAGSAGYAFVEINPTIGPIPTPTRWTSPSTFPRASASISTASMWSATPAPSTGDPSRTDADGRRRLQPRADGAVAQQPARPGLLQGREGRGNARQRAGPFDHQRQCSGAAHRRTVGRRGLQLGRLLHRQPGHFRAELPRSRPERGGASGMGFAASAGRFPVHRAEVLGPRPARGLRPVPLALRPQQIFVVRLSVDRRGLRLSYPLNGNMLLSTRYFLKSDEIIVPTGYCTGVGRGSSALCDQVGSFINSSVGYTLQMNYTNDPVRPTRGWAGSLRQDLAGLGGDVNYVKTEADASWYYGITPAWVVSVQGSAGYVSGWNGDPIRINDRFFKGGNSFRGFETAGMGPRDLNTTDALGGNFYAIGTVELTLPNYLPEQYGIKTSLFADVGTLGVLDDRYKLTSNGTVNTNIADELSLRASAGVSIHWKSPMGPIRFDISKVLSKEDYDKTESFRFSTSTQF